MERGLTVLWYQQPPSDCSKPLAGGADPRIGSETLGKIKKDLRKTICSRVKSASREQDRKDISFG